MVNTVWGAAGSVANGAATTAAVSCPRLRFIWGCDLRGSGETDARAAANAESTRNPPPRPTKRPTSRSMPQPIFAVGNKCAVATAPQLVRSQLSADVKNEARHQ